MPTAVDRTGGRRARARPQRAPAPGPPPSEPGRGGRVLRLHLEQLAGELTGVRVVGEELLRDHPGPGLSASHLTPRHGTPRAGGRVTSRTCRQAIRDTVGEPPRAHLHRPWNGIVR